MKFAAILTLATLVFAEHSQANVLSLFPVGTDAKSAAMESAIDSRDPQGLLYNPAAMALGHAGFQGEVGVGRLLYSYEHPTYDPVRVSLFAPVVSAGWHGESQNKSLHWGVAVAPVAMNNLKINGLPRRVSGKVESLDVNTTRKQFHLPIGAAYSLNGDPRTTIGASLITTYEERKLQADSLVDGAHLVELSTRATLFRPEIGAVYGAGPVDVGVSYMNSATKKFDVTSALGVNEAVEYDPAVLATGVRGTYEQWNASLNVNRIFGAKGANLIRDGINNKVTEGADVRDVNHIGGRIGYKLDDTDSFSAAYAYLPSIWGAGSYNVDKDSFSHLELGHIFGTFNAMPVHNQAVTWRHRGNSVDYNTGLFRTAGTQTVDVTGDNPGHYQLEFVAITTGISSTF